MNWHQLIDQRSFEMDQVIAEKLREAPGLLKLAVQWIETKLAQPQFSDQSKDALREWLEVIDTQGVPGVLHILHSDDDEANRMRQNAPFALLMPEDKRREILDKYESLRSRTHLAGI